MSSGQKRRKSESPSGVRPISSYFKPLSPSSYESPRKFKNPVSDTRNGIRGRQSSEKGKQGLNDVQIIDVAQTPSRGNDKPPRTPNKSPVTANKYVYLPDNEMDLSMPVQQQHKRLDQKPITPSSTTKSSMNNSLVFDIVTSLSTNDPDVAISALRSVVALGKEYPTPLLFQELLDQIENETSYSRAVAIYSSLIFVMEQASQCQIAIAFPMEWTAVDKVLQDLVLSPMNDKWQRILLVLQFMEHLFDRDMLICQERFAATNKDWIHQTRLSILLSEEKKDRRTKKVLNNAILSALGRLVDLWIRVYDSGECNEVYLQDGRECCVAATRLLEMLMLLTDQVDNALQRIQSSLQPMSQATKYIFLHTLKHPAVKSMLGTAAVGRSKTSRCKEMEWFDCIAESHFIAKQSSGKLQTTMETEGRDLERFAALHLKTYASNHDPSKVRHLFKHILNLQKR
ncbi:hypothetical protein LEN26_002366 [Aphanomyces euteiches]|nr:hypothetical protein AeMF1_021468 [Aphanomyces euteiches]KAH9159375.1 hypothetical protein LEN26_002366 [Aphanomyces euteiches]KAH9195341.1 hypothetical protein AeNC1_002674 [Aphanomyces euteiches]